MLSYLRSTVSYQVMNLVVALELQAKARNTDEYREFAKEQDELRYKRIIHGRPYQPMFA